MQWNPKLVIALSTAVVLLGAQSAQAMQQTEEGEGCIGIFYFEVQSCPEDMKQACADHFGPILGCGKPKQANCGPNGEQILVQCAYNRPD